MLGAALASPAVAEATFPGANGRIAYQTGSPFNSTIETINPDGTDPLQLGPGQNPSWSADGTKIVFDYGADIWTMNTDGTGRTKILDSPYYCDTLGHMGCYNNPYYDPALSPDGTKVAFEAGWDSQGDPDSSGFSEVWMFTVNPGGPNFAPLAAAASNQPDWSPDGSLIAYNADDCCFFPSGRIHTIHPDGTGVRAISTDTNWGDFPSWSPDGATLRTVARAPVKAMRSTGSTPTARA